jgi:hypothetical protein
MAHNMSQFNPMKSQKISRSMDLIFIVSVLLDGGDRVFETLEIHSILVATVDSQRRLHCIQSP